MILQSDSGAGMVDESSNKKVPLEWWFVQGCFEDAGVGPGEFMFSLFRHSLDWGCVPLGNSWALMVSVLDTLTGNVRTLSQVDSTTLSFFPIADKLLPLDGLDKLAMRAVYDEIRAYGPPHPIRVARGKPDLETKPFRAAWGDCELRQDDGHFVIKFKEPETGRLLTFRLIPSRPRIHLKDIDAPGGGKMDYACHTRLALEGEVDGLHVEGQAWLDHQWGARGWLLGGDRQETIFGWDWLGIQLDDGRDMLVFVHRHQGGGKIVSQFAVEVEPGGESRLHHNFNLTDTGWWTSPRTETRYPVRWRIHLPDSDIEIHFEPLTEDQEIPALPPIRAVWEGAGKVTGTVRGITVSGRARLELHGYAYLADFRKFMEQLGRRIHENIEHHFPHSFTAQDLEQWAGPALGEYDHTAQSAMIARPLWDLIDRRGKHWRPALGIFLLRAMGVNPAPYESLISFITEIPHAGAIIIDDIHDNASLRRGEPCIHVRYGTDVAINAANAAYFMPMVLLGNHPALTDGQKLELYRALSRLLIGAHFGQGQDIHWSKNLTEDRLHDWMSGDMESKLILVYTQKTSSVIEAAAECASVIAGADGELRQACTDFARTLGIAFQMVDDILDFSEERMVAGSGGADLREGKITYVILHALRKLRAPQRKRLETILCTPILRQNNGVIAEGGALVRRSGAMETCHKSALAMVKKEWKKLSRLLPPSEAKQMLRILWTCLLNQGCKDGRAENVSTR